MTHAEIQAEILRNVEDNQENEKIIACLMSKARRAKRALDAIDWEHDELDPKALNQPIMDMRDMDIRAVLQELRAALHRRKEILSFFRVHGLDGKMSP